MRSALIPAVLTLAALIGLASPAVATIRYDVTIARQDITPLPGETVPAITLNGTVPGPVLRLKEGEEAVVRMTNRLDVTTSIHWHGLLVPGPKDGSPGFNAFAGIKPGETQEFRFPVRQNGTYWYHAHSATQEQAGQYGALIIDPAGTDPIVSDRQHVVLISELTRQDPERILRNLKGDSDYYNWNKRTLPQMLRDAGKFGLGRVLKDRAGWATMRMDATDISDVSGYRLMANGAPSGAAPWLEARKGERVRLRLINGTAMSLVDVRIPGAAMTVVAADGRQVQPVTVDELRMGVAETYDVIVEPRDDTPLGLWIESIDRKANVLVTLAAAPGVAAAAPPARPKQILLMSEMGHAMAGAPTAAGTTTAAPPPNDPTCPAEHAAMGHCVPKPAATPVPAADPACPPEHAAMGHCVPTAATPAVVPSGPRVGSAVLAGGTTPFPRVDYGYGSVDHAGMRHDDIAPEGQTDGSGRVFGWASGAPHGARVLSIRDLVAANPQTDTRAPTREIVVRVSGNMTRYIWTLNGAKYGEAPPLRVGFGERVRITFINESMMAHPMHLHGMFFQVENGQAMDRLPDKNVIVVAPGRTQSVLLTADEAGEWPLHCHLLYHMESGMMQKLVVASVDQPDGSPAIAAAPHH